MPNLDKTKTTAPTNSTTVPTTTTTSNDDDVDVQGFVSSSSLPEIQMEQKQIEETVGTKSSSLSLLVNDDDNNNLNTGNDKNEEYESNENFVAAVAATATGTVGVREVEEEGMDTNKMDNDDRMKEQTKVRIEQQKQQEEEEVDGKALQHDQTQKINVTIDITDKEMTQEYKEKNEDLVKKDEDGEEGAIIDHEDHLLGHRDALSTINMNTNHSDIENSSTPKTNNMNTFLMMKDKEDVDNDDKKIDYEKEEEEQQRRRRQVEEGEETNNIDDDVDDDDENDEMETQRGGADAAAEEEEEEIPLLYYTRIQGTSLRPPPRTNTPQPSAMSSGDETNESAAAVTTTTTLSSLPFAVDCTCSSMGQIRWSPDILHVEGGTADVFFRTGRPDVVAATTIPGTTTGLTTGTSSLPAASTSSTTTTGVSNLIPFGGGAADLSGGGLGLSLPSPLDQSQQEQQQQTTTQAGDRRSLEEGEEEAAAAAAAAKLAMEQPMPVVALGFSNGTVQVLDGRHEQAVVLSAGTVLQVRDGTPKPRGSLFPPVVALDWDATGTCLAALDQGGMCTIWEYKLEYTWRNSSSTGNGGLFSSSSTSGGNPSNPSTTSTTNTTPAANSTTARVFTSFLSALTGSTVTTPSGNAGSAGPSSSAATSAVGATGSCWRMTAIQTTRIGYPQTFGPSTVLALDPAYKRRREKAAIVGFGDGRLIMTKRGILFQRRVDNVLYQQAASTTTKTSNAATINKNVGVGSSAGGGSSDTIAGIQALVWRGSLVAWADATGIRLLDAEQLTRLAHIDPPVGARPSLYAHQLRDMKPHLCFETSSKLLVAWGDCLLQLRIQNTMVRTTTQPLPSPSAVATPSAVPPGTPQQQPQNSVNTNSNNNGETQSMVAYSEEQGTAGTNESGEGGSVTSTSAWSVSSKSTGVGPPPATPPATVAAATTTTIVRRRTVECTMAWQLDCVACGLAPLDEDHVMILGAVVVTPTTTTAQYDSSDKSSIGTITNDMELQVISRLNGQVTYADLLPLIRKTPLPTLQGTTSLSPTSKKKNNNRSSSATSTKQQQPLVESVSSFALLSSFHLPRMDDASEMQMELHPGVSSTSFDFLYGAVDSAGVLPGASLAGAAAGVQSSVSSYYGSGGGITGVGVGNLTSSPQHPDQVFRDSHLRWNLNMASFLVENNRQGTNDDDDGREGGKENENTTTLHADDVDDDNNSIDSDVYSFVCRPVTLQRSTGVTEVTSDPSISLTGGNSLSPSSNNSRKLTVPQPPRLMVVSQSDAVAVRIRTIDDAVDYALIDGKPATALQRAIVHAPGLRQFTIGDVVSEYYHALLRLPPSTRDDDEDDDHNNFDENRLLISHDDDGTYRRLSLRRMKLAAYSMPVLLGGDVALWSKWIDALGNIPGSLFVVWKWIPVRDPILPQSVYTNALCRMMEHVDHLRHRSDNDGVDLEKLVMEAENHFLQALLAWGSSLVLKEFMKLYKYQTERSPRYSNLLAATEKNLRRRYEQTSAVYLSFPIEMDVDEDSMTYERSTEDQYPVDVGMLFSVQTMWGFMTDHLEKSQESSKVVLEAKARLSMMKGDYDNALRCFLTIGARHGPITLEEVEGGAVDSVIEPLGQDGNALDLPHSLVIALIENRNLHQCLLQDGFTFEMARVPPLFALLQLVGHDAVGDFLLEHCVAPQETSKLTAKGTSSSPPDAPQKERSNSMPLDIVAAQLEASPKILFWYLHALFTRRPELYVNFPKTANLPASITSLYRKGLDLYIKYAGNKRDSSKALEGIETYRVTQVETPLLTFIRAVLEVGGMSPAEVGKRLQIERNGGAGVSPIFALELAHIMENYGNDSEEESRLVLDLYLKGAGSLMHAVSFAQRKTDHSSELWEMLIEYCLGGNSAASSGGDGLLFGRLLESAALSGANLAHLVAQIPPGMSIEGLRPRLVAAVADYRWKLQLHEGASEVAKSEKIDLLRESAHRSKRGVRYHPSDGIEMPVWAKSIWSSSPSSLAHATESPDSSFREQALTILPPNLRPRIRKQHNSLLHFQPYQ